MTVQTNPSEQLTQLLGRVALRDREAFSQLYRQSVSHLIPVALRILKKRELAEEAVQEAYVQIWQKAPEFRADAGSARTWMSAITRYRALDMLRRMPREDSLDDGQTADVGFEPIRRLGHQVDLDLCLEELSEEQQQAIGMAYLAGYSHSELAARLKAPLGTVKSWVRRGLTALRECLAR